MSQRLFSAVLLLFWLLCTGFAWMQASDYQAAISLVQRGEFDQALSLLQKILDRSPGDLKSRNLMGIALSGAGRRQDANEQFKKVLAKDPRFVPSLKNLAVNELTLGLSNDARIHFEEALKLVPDDPTSHLGLGEIAFAARKFDAAVAHYEQSGDLALKDPRVTLRFATSCAEAKQPSKAAALLEKVTPDADADTQFQVGVILARLEMFDTAARRFQLARNGFQDPYQAGFNLVLMLVKSGDYASAARTATEMLGAGYRKAELYNLLAQAYEKGGSTKDAYDSLRSAIKLDPEDETNYLDLVTLCLDHENYDLGLEIADVGLLRIPRSHRLHLQRGAVLAMNGQFEDAEKEFQVTAQLSPDAGLARLAMGFVLMKVEKFSEAIDLLRGVSLRSPTDPYALWFLGEALNRSGVIAGSEGEKEAINALEKAIQLNPRLQPPRALLGKILLRRGEVQRAARELEKALDLDPEDMTATYQLAQALQKKGDTTRAKQLFSKVEKARTAERDPTQRNLMRILKDRSQ